MTRIEILESVGIDHLDLYANNPELLKKIFSAMQKAYEQNKFANEPLLIDDNGETIIAGDLFEFKFLEELQKSVPLKGKFVWNEVELKFEIQVLDNDDYSWVDYQPGTITRGFVKLKVVKGGV